MAQDSPPWRLLMPLCEITPLLSRERSLFCCCMLHDLMPFVDAHAAEASPSSTNNETGSAAAGK
jgi:hypothetical protein